MNVDLLKLKKNVTGLLFSSIIGLMIICVNFPTHIENQVIKNIEFTFISEFLLGLINLLQKVISLLHINSPEQTFFIIMTINFFLIFLYFICVMIFALRHFKPLFIIHSFIGLTVGFIVINLLSWLVIIFLKIFKFILQIILWAKNLITSVVEFLFVDYLALTLIFFTLLILYSFRSQFLKTLITMVGMIFMFLGLYNYVPKIWHWFLEIIKPLIFSIKSFFNAYLLPIISFLILIISKLIVIFLYITILFFSTSAVGSVIIDQYKSSRISSKGAKGIFLSSFSIGSALALILLTSTGSTVLNNILNNSWFYSLKILGNILEINILSFVTSTLTPQTIFSMMIPQSVENYLLIHLSNPQPTVDSVILLSVLIISIISLIIGTVKEIEFSPEDDTIDFLPKEFFVIFGFLFLSISMIFSQSLPE